MNKLNTQTTIRLSVALSMVSRRCRFIGVEKVEIGTYAALTPQGQVAMIANVPGYGAMLANSQINNWTVVRVVQG